MKSETQKNTKDVDLSVLSNKQCKCQIRPLLMNIAMS